VNLIVILSEAKDRMATVAILRCAQDDRTLEIVN